MGTPTITARVDGRLARRMTFEIENEYLQFAVEMSLSNVMVIMTYLLEYRQTAHGAPPMTTCKRMKRW